MADVLRIKRRPVGGAAGPPSSLAASEIAFNEQTNILYYGGGNSLGLATSIFAIGGAGAFLSLIGGTLAGGVSFGGALAPGGVADLSRHITLHTAGYGLSITSGRMNFVSGGSHFFVIGSTDVMQVSASGINSAAIGATTPSTGAFTALTATSPAIGTSDTNVATTLFAARMHGYLNNGSLPGFDSDLTITAAQAGQRVVRFTGALTADRTYTLPSVNQRNWVLWNNTTGGYNLIFTLGGTTISIPSGYRGEIFNDGTSVFGAHNCLPAQAVRIGPGDRNGILFTSGATLASAATIEATGTGAISLLTTVALSGTPTAPTAAAATNSTQIATTAYVTSAIAAYADDIGRNYTHNALFRIWQRGAVSFTTHLAYTADRWQLWHGADTVTVTRSALTDTERTQIADEDAVYALQAACTGTAGAGDNIVIQQRIEGMRRLSNRQITVSFYAVAASGTPKVGVSYDQIFGSGGSPSAQVSGAGTAVTLSTTWTRYSVSLTLPATAAKVFGTNGDDNTAINLWLSSGATNNTRAGLIGVQTATVKFWGVQVEIGVLTPVEKIDLSLDWNNCQRFYQASVIGLGGYAAAGALFGYYVVLPVAMQRTPTVNVISATYTNASAGAANSISPTSFFAQATATALGTASFLYTYLASADL